MTHGRKKPPSRGVPVAPTARVDEPRLRELVFVATWENGKASFMVLLTRVPGLGEELVKEGRTYRIVRVQHEPVGDDGRTWCGWHAMVNLELLPEEPVEPRKRKTRGR